MTNKAGSTQATPSKAKSKAATPRLQAVLSLARFDASPAGNVIKASPEPLVSWSDQDKGFYHALMKTTLRYWAVESAILEALTQKNWRKTAPLLKTVLRVGLAQLRYMPHLPHYAVVHDMVEVVKVLVRRKKLPPHIVGFANAVLQNYLRQADQWPLESAVVVGEAGENLSEALFWSSGWPAWWTEKLLAHYSWQQVQAMAKAAQMPEAMCLRVNLAQCSLTEFKAALAAQNIATEAFVHPDLNPNGRYPLVMLPHTVGSPTQLPGFEQGWFVVQDPASAWVGWIVDAKPGEVVVDCCAAPGMKTTVMAVSMMPDPRQGELVGHLLAMDPEEKRIERLNENLTRLGIEGVTVLCREVESGLPPAPFDMADCVLLDAPCSGTGTVRKHPELLIHRENADWETYPALQTRLLDAACKWVKPGGRLLYSTCSILPEENSQQIAAFLATHSAEWELSWEKQLPIGPHSDGFYAAMLHKL